MGGICLGGICHEGYLSGGFCPDTWIFMSDLATWHWMALLRSNSNQCFHVLQGRSLPSASEIIPLYCYWNSGTTPPTLETWLRWLTRSKSLWSDSYCWNCLEMSGKLLIPCYICQPSSNGGMKSAVLIDVSCCIKGQILARDETTKVIQPGVNFLSLSHCMKNCKSTLNLLFSVTAETQENGWRFNKYWKGKASNVLYLHRNNRNAVVYLTSKGCLV